jgi:hypothetical protein
VPRDQRFAHYPGTSLKLIWVRPDNPAVALQLTQAAVESDNPGLFATLPSTIESMGIGYTFVGWVSRDERRVLDEHGKVVGKPKPGDSMITENILKHQPS